MPTKFKIMHWEAELWQDGVMVAGVSGPSEASVDREIRHYARVYKQDGPVEIKFKPPKRS